MFLTDGPGDDGATDGAASDFETSEGLRFFLDVRDGTGAATSSSCDALRFRKERVPSASPGRMRSLKMEWPLGSTPRTEGSKSLASLGTDDSLRRVIDSELFRFSISSLSSSSWWTLFWIQALQRQSFASVDLSVSNHTCRSRHHTIVRPNIGAKRVSVAGALPMCCRNKTCQPPGSSLTPCCRSTHRDRRTQSRQGMVQNLDLDPRLQTGCSNCRSVSLSSLVLVWFGETNMHTLGSLLAAPESASSSLSS